MSTNTTRNAAFGDHAWKRALAVANGQRVGGVIPMDGNGGVGALFVVVVVVLVFIEDEVAVRAREDSKFDGSLLDFALQYSTLGPRGRMDPART